MAPPAAAVVALALAVVAQVPDLADLALLAQLLDLSDLAVEARLLDLADLVVEARLLDLLSRQSFSAAMARTTP